MSHRGLEPLTLWLKVKCSTTWANGSNWLGWKDSNLCMTRPKPVALPLGYSPILEVYMERGRFELPNPKERIYSPPRLATSLPLHKWCRPEDLNPQPTDYKSVALPIELGRLFIKVVQDGIEPPTQGFSILCSTDWATGPQLYFNK